ncbi:hypothetical protein [Methylocystis suflitae]|uniref:hypothetical protein n=1 Tax=Methylocystis suflitae TaxID=2951405 RepID=UPI0021092A52|nr:hypothetical protein [Methylocystis suflitae]MCQ4188695.1 hypothetical protein [Methylocystis suflitae]
MFFSPSSFETPPTAAPQDEGEENNSSQDHCARRRRSSKANSSRWNMTTKAKKKFRSAIAEAAHETASGLHRTGLIDAKTMREFDAACLKTIPQPRGFVFILCKMAYEKPEGFAVGPVFWWRRR